MKSVHRNLRNVKSATDKCRSSLRRASQGEHFTFHNGNRNSQMKRLCNDHKTIFHLARTIIATQLVPIHLLHSNISMFIHIIGLAIENLFQNIVQTKNS